MKHGWLQSFATALKLGLLSFGGPTAHIGYFREEYVNRKKWLDDRSFADLVALCQLLPGPASSQVGIAIGWMRAGWLGSLAAWIGFTLPSAAILAAFAWVRSSVPGAADAGWLRGLELAAVAIVASAVLGMGRTLAPDKPRVAILVATAAAVLLLPYAWTQVAAIAAAGAIGFALKRGAAPAAEASPPAAAARGRFGAAALLLLFAALLVGLPIAREAGALPPLLSLFESFYRAGSLVFGGGHVVLPLLEREVVPSGWVSAESFAAGYAATQAMPGPLFTFASYLGADSHGWAGAAVATAAIFLPGYLLVIGALPFWQSLRRIAGVAHVVYGINAAVVGLLLAALYDPLFTGAVTSSADFAIAAALYALLAYWKLPPWALVAVAALTGAVVFGW
ncbi:chromate efflux transporter [Paenibacillus antri]|uniref:Chromate efflux transporter n=1 Tax=Paenibacillus antri TaxID=2582848 RepID=A0A5R9G3U2_9BACL|nr:chromate efflux transporter [Paenibacillus antri]TLS49679.1 chromate efflux transporter [Paenibacillus antri]